MREAGYLLLPSLSLLGATAALAESDASSLGLLPTLLLLLVLGALMSLLHELAHAGVASLLGLRVFTICLGTGRSLFAFHLGKTKLDLRSLPLGGCTIMASPPMPGFRLRLFLSVLAGPAVHALFLCCLLPLIFVPRLVPHSPLAASLVRLAGWVNAVLLIGGLWPGRDRSAYGEAETDGRRLARIPRLSGKEAEEFYAAHDAYEALAALNAGDYAEAQRWAREGVERYPYSAVATSVLGIILLQVGEPALAREVFVRALHLPETNGPQSRFVRLNNIAYADVAIGDPELLPEADRYSAEAHAGLLGDPAVIGTRGAVLVKLGRVEEGILLLKQALERHVDPWAKAMDACHIALAEKCRGNLAAAHRYLELARSIDPRCFLIERVKGLLIEFGG